MAGLIEVLAPDEQEGTQSTVLQWLKQPGDAIAKHEPLVELETDKVTVEVPAPASGVLREIVLHQQASVEPGDLLGRIEPGVEAQPAIARATREKVATPAPAARASGGRLSPAVRRLLDEHGLDAADIAGSGQGGRITHQDVL
ncbi:MAG: biotin/lipoyl-containing protein, partial [Gammaproteobacteria bacterium]